MVNKLDQQTYTSEFESHWVPYSLGLVPNQSKELRKLIPHIPQSYKAGATQSVYVKSYPGPGSDGNEFCIPQSLSITWASPSDCFVSYPWHSLGEAYPSADTQLMYFTLPLW